MANSLQSVGGSASSVGLITLTFGSNTTNGSAIVIAIGSFFGEAPGSCADNKGNTYTLAGQTPSHNALIYVAENIVGGASHSVTFTASTGGCYFVAVAAEYANVATAASVDKTAATDTAGTPNYSSGSTATTSQNDELLLGVQHRHAAGIVFTPSGSWVNVKTQDDGSFHTMNLQDQIVASTGTYASTGSLTLGGQPQSVIVTLKLAGGGGGGGGGSVAAAAYYYRLLRQQ